LLAEAKQIQEKLVAYMKTNNIPDVKLPQNGKPIGEDEHHTVSFGEEPPVENV
jgi:hypothetical protein